MLSRSEKPKQIVRRLLSVGFCRVGGRGDHQLFRHPNGTTVSLSTTDRRSAAQWRRQVSRLRVALQSIEVSP
jgi:hypothetical protein